MNRRSFLLLLAAASQYAQSKESIMSEEQFYIDKMVVNTRAASLWVVQHGIETYTKSGTEAIKRKLIDEWACQLSGDALIGRAEQIARFQVYGRGIYCDIDCLVRVSGKTIFEYWLVGSAGESWAGVRKWCLFLITQADSVDGVRKIIHQSDRFFQSYKVNDTVVVQLPHDDLKLLYKLQAWRYPESYPDSDLKNWEIRIYQGGRYERVPAKR